MDSGNKLNRDQRRRRQVLRKDGYKCVECDSTHRLTIDHIIPRSRGGRRRAMSNLQTLCYDCNQKKAAELQGVVLCPRCKGKGRV